MEKSTPKDDKITRAEALKKMGKYAAFTAVGAFLILNPQKAQAQSPGSAEPPNTGLGGDIFQQ
jgi:hypothetical protein